MYTMADTDQEKVYKTPVYVRNAKRNYHYRKFQADPEYAEKVRSISREWHKKKREEDEEFKQKYQEKNLELSKKRSEENMKAFVYGEGFKDLLDQIPDCFKSEKVKSANMETLIRNTLLSEVNGVPLYMRLKVDHPKRRIKSICVAVIYYVATLIDANVSASEVVRCYSVSNASIRDIHQDIQKQIEYVESLM